MGLVPVVDLSASGAASAIDAAATEIGFFQVTGHGVPDEVVDAMLEATERFFHASHDLKSSCLPATMAINRGWSPLGKESLAYSLGVEAPPDLFEAFNIGHELDPADPVHVANRDGFFAPNLWPDLDGFRESYLAYFDAVEALARRITPVLAVALGLDERFFVGSTDHSPDVLRVNWYERGHGAPAPLPGQQRMGAHTDYGVLTVLWADPVPGFEIMAPDGSWAAVTPEPGCFLVNLGDLLAQWTNDRWRSTLHRVVPPVGDGACLRRSAAFFHEANADALIEVLPTCLGPDGAGKYPPVTAGEHLRRKLEGSRELRPSSAHQTIGDRSVV